MTGASRGIGHFAAEYILAKEPGTHVVILAVGPPMIWLQKAEMCR
ncbi:hypothetical protein [Paenarthrobacter nicotinovorans]|nr:hypothetical protein [Paenarthrobacter nicotinovorans]